MINETILLVEAFIGGAFFFHTKAEIDGAMCHVKSRVNSINNVVTQTVNKITCWYEKIHYVKCMKALGNQI
jgi:hypothetical protein